MTTGSAGCVQHSRMLPDAGGSKFCQRRLLGFDVPRRGYLPAMNLHYVLGSVERVEALDAPAEATSRLAGRLIGRGRFARGLHGSWLGHPVHPLLITLPIGTWIASAVFDVVFKDVTAARRLLAVGLAATPPTVLAGWADYTLLDRRQQRVGLVHATSNGVGVTMFALSWRAYRQQRHRAARLYTLLGLTAISVGGALGGHLSYAQGAGMFRWQAARAVTHRSPVEYLRAA